MRNKGIKALEVFAGISSPFLSLRGGAHLGEVVWLLTASPQKFISIERNI